MVNIMDGFAPVKVGTITSKTESTLETISNCYTPEKKTAGRLKENGTNSTSTMISMKSNP